ncbi:MAG: hypothetical protein LBU91_03980 [Bacteroidales bacterium]|nr:hypothetical protein [Bacteroidales bacterium]
MKTKQNPSHPVLVDVNQLVSIFAESVAQKLDQRLLQQLHPSKPVAVAASAPTEEECDENRIPVKIQAAIITQFLTALNAGKAHNDLTKICKLIAFLTGKSYVHIHNEMQKGIHFSTFHRKQIQEANTILNNLNLQMAIDCNSVY